MVSTDVGCKDKWLGLPTKEDEEEKGVETTACDHVKKNKRWVSPS